MAINYCVLIHMGFKGNKYIWLNKCFKHKYALILERLNRFLANDEWLHYFPDAQVHHLPRTHFNHCPLLLTLHKIPYWQNEKIFKIETIWMFHPDLGNIISDSWVGTLYIV